MTVPSTPDPLAAIRERAEKACPGPWSVEDRDGYITGHITAKEHTYCGNKRERRDSVTAPASMTHADAAFIAAARSDVPFLLGEVDRLSGQVRAVRELCDCWETGACDKFVTAAEVRAALAGTSR